MIKGWHYRWIAVTGVGVISLITVLVTNLAVSQQLITTYVPLFWRLEPTVLSGRDLLLTGTVSVISVSVLLIPLYKPRPRRILDTAVLAQRQVLIAGLVLAALGYFNWTYRVPRGMLTLYIGLLSLVLPAWFISIRRRDHNTIERTIIVGDDTAQMDQIITVLDGPVLGYLCPANTYRSLEQTPQAALDDEQRAAAVTDGGRPVSQLNRLGGLSQLEDTFIRYDVDSVVLAFQTADRGEFFGTLDVCDEYGVSAQVHREYADDVLTATSQVDTLVDVELEPLDPQDYLFKRLFDVGFSSFGLLALAPVMFVIAVAIKLDSPGPIFYEQERTAGFGDTFPVYKFRTMIPENESSEPVEDDDNDRITRVGRVLRQTHMDEVPQLWSIFTGQMSVVGPRAAWIEEEESFLEQEAKTWRKRWFVKPGLTGLAQINDAKSTDPEAKLRYDLRYIREQSFWFDLKIVTRQIWGVIADAVALGLGREPVSADPDSSESGRDRADD